MDDKTASMDDKTTPMDTKSTTMIIVFSYSSGAYDGRGLPDTATATARPRCFPSAVPFPPIRSYINDKPTGAVVGLQPFGGARASGTNDKAGGEFNLIRWIIPRVIKETLVSPTDYRYSYMK